MSDVRSRFFARDLAAMLRLSDARKAENAEARRACLNAELRTLLASLAARRGVPLDWEAYFRAVGL